jgi:hypothetical protein
MMSRIASRILAMSSGSWCCRLRFPPPPRPGLRGRIPPPPPHILRRGVPPGRPDRLRDPPHDLAGGRSDLFRVHAPTIRLAESDACACARLSAAGPMSAVSTTTTLAETTQGFHGILLVAGWLAPFDYCQRASGRSMKVM